MSSYLPPSDNLPSFNPSVFQSSFTDEEVESKIKTLESNEADLQTSVDNLETTTTGITYVSSGDKTTIDNNVNINEKVLNIIAPSSIQGDEEISLLVETSLQVSTSSVTTAGKGTIHMSIPSGATQGDGELGTGISFSRINSNRRGALIASFQDGSDRDRCGLKFFTKDTSQTGTDEVEIDALTIKSSGGIIIGSSNYPVVSSAQKHITSGLNDDGTSTGTQSFGITYTSTPVVTCQVVYASAGGYVVVNIHTVTTTGFSYRKYRTGTGGATAVTTEGEFYWNAIGEASL